MHSLIHLENHLHPGSVYRHLDLTNWSKAVDRHLQQLQKKGTLVKLSAGLYYCTKKTYFGSVPPEDAILIASFLKDDRFLITTPNAYNSLEVGTTQLYNNTIVYNHKRHGFFRLGNRVFDFRMKQRFPNKLSFEFLLVDLVNNIENLAEDKDQILKNVKKKALTMDIKILSQFVAHYGKRRTKKFFSSILENEGFQNGD